MTLDGYVYMYSLCVVSYRYLV